MNEPKACSYCPYTEETHGPDDEDDDVDLAPPAPLRRWGPIRRGLGITAAAFACLGAVIELRHAMDVLDWVDEHRG